MIRRLAVGAWLAAVWMGLWADLSVANLASGVVVAVVVLALFPLDPLTRRGSVRPVAAARYVAFFAWQLLSANVQVAWEVLTPRNRDNEGIICMPVVPSASDTLLTLIVNSIGLTPGTMVIDLGERQRSMYVHVLHLDDVDDARANLMRFQELAVRAFGSSEAIAELASLATAGGAAVSEPSTPDHPSADEKGSA